MKLSLNDEIGNFSKRREVEPSKKYEDEYDDWEDDEDEENEYASLGFKLYKLHELDKLNAEVEELDKLITPWWKNLRTIFSKSTMGKIGLVDIKKKHLLSDDSFDDVFIENKSESLDALKIFSKTLSKSHWGRFKSNIYGIAFYLLFAYFTGWNMFWYFLIGWSLFDMGLRQFKYGKQKEWLIKAETFIHTQSGDEVEVYSDDEEDTLEDIMAFNEMISKQEKEHWSIKVYDAIANLFTRKK